MTLRDILLDIRAQHGKLTAEVVLDEATDPTHPLHNRLEWDDTVAAHQHRLEQCRQMIRSVKVKWRETDDGPVRSVRAFHSLPNEQAQTYEPIDDIVEDPFQLRLLKAEMLRAIAELERRYGHLQAYREWCRSQV